MEELDGNERTCGICLDLPLKKYEKHRRKIGCIFWIYLQNIG
jgi:hypothetical protein